MIKEFKVILTLGKVHYQNTGKLTALTLKGIWNMKGGKPPLIEAI
jgi:hypothetical protein